MATKTQEKTARERYRAYQWSSDYSLRDVYGSYSEKKHKAFEDCRKKCADLDGEGLKIIAHNGWVFTAGFTYIDKTTGKYMFYYITPTYDCAVEV